MPSLVFGLQSRADAAFKFRPGTAQVGGDLRFAHTRRQQLTRIILNRQGREVAEFVGFLGMTQQFLQ